jgi:hypothetical protein
MTLLFLKTDDERQKQFAILNLSRFVYMEGIDETEEYPNGAKSAVYFDNGAGRVIEIPYLKMMEMIRKAIEQEYVNSEIIARHRLDSHLKGTKEMMTDVLSGNHHPTS